MEEGSEGKLETNPTERYGKKRLIVIAVIVLLLLGGGGVLAARLSSKPAGQQVSKTAGEQEKKGKRKSGKASTACPSKMTYESNGTSAVIEISGSQKRVDLNEATELTKNCVSMKIEDDRQSPQNSQTATQNTNSTLQSAVVTYDSLSMITPYVNESDVSSINEAFGLDASTAAWGFVHNGVDFMTATDLVEFRAAADGVVTFSKFHNDGNGKWQVNMSIDHNPWSIQYAWEFSSDQESEADKQMADITVTSGQTVKQGDSLGRLYNPKLEGHIHFGVLNNSINSTNAICPEPYLTAEAKASIYHLIQKDHPAWQICY